MNRKTFIQRATLGVAALSQLPLKGSTGTLPVGVEDWSGIRGLFPLTRDRIYLNTGGLGPPSKMVLDTMCGQIRRQAAEGEHSHESFHSARESISSFAGADPNEIAFTRNATEANSIIAAGLDLRAGDEVIFESHAHPGGSFPWLNRQKVDGIKVRIFEPDPLSPEDNLERIFSLVNDRTRIIQVSHLTAPSGILFDVHAIAKEARQRGIWFHIDGAQSAGMIPIDMHAIGCDSYATSGHKWLNGPQESGFLYIASERNNEVACSHAGAYSASIYSLPGSIEIENSATRHEYGTRDAGSILGLVAALDLQTTIGRQRIAEHGKRLANLAREAISDLPGLEVLTPEHPAMHNSILSFRIKGLDAQEIFGELRDVYQLRCRPVSEQNLNAVRVCWHVYNGEADLQALKEALSSICGRA